jgi:xylulokinase
VAALALPLERLRAARFLFAAIARSRQQPRRADRGHVRGRRLAGLDGHEDHGAVPGNGGCLGFFIAEPEISPPILATGVRRFGPRDERLAEFPPNVEVRFLSIRAHVAHVGITSAIIVATGGASVERSILQVMADVLGVPVWTTGTPNSAALGAAYRALHGLRCRQEARFVPFTETLRGAPPHRVAAEPDPDAHGAYTRLLERFEREGQIVVTGR